MKLGLHLASCCKCKSSSRSNEHLTSNQHFPKPNDKSHAITVNAQRLPQQVLLPQKLSSGIPPNQQAPWTSPANEQDYEACSCFPIKNEEWQDHFLLPCIICLPQFLIDCSNLSCTGTGTGTGMRMRMENGNSLKFNGFWYQDVLKYPNGDVSETKKGNFLKLSCIIRGKCYWKKSIFE